MTELQKRQYSLEKVVTMISDHIYVATLTEAGLQSFLFLSEQLDQLTGYAAERFKTNYHLWQSLIHPDDREIFDNHLQQLEQGRHSQVEYRLIRKDDTVIWIRDSAQIECEPDQEVITAYGIISDITQRKKIHELMAEARDQALETSRQKSHLLANVSHDLRTPLATILGYAQLLEMGALGTFNEKQGQTVAGIIRNTQYLTNLVNDLLDQAKLEDGKLKLNITSFVPADIVNQVQSTMNVPAHTKGLTLITDFAPDVPLTVSGDSDRVHQILANLVSNAIKYTVEGTVHVRLFRPNQTHWALQVSDTGIGIAPKDQSEIFEPFSRLEDAESGDFSGTGLGLSIVKQLTTLMGGYITLESDVGQGSVFTVCLPLQILK